MYWDGFRILNMQRTSNESGPQPLAVCDVLAYGNMHTFEPWECAFLLEIIVELDQIYLTNQYKKIQEAKEKASRK